MEITYFLNQLDFLIIFFTFEKEKRSNKIYVYTDKQTYFNSDNLLVSFTKLTFKFKQLI